MSCGFFGFRFHIVGYSAKAAKQGVQRLLNWRVTATSKLNSESYASQPGVEGGFLCSIRSWITMQKSKVFTETKNIANCSSVKKYVVAKTNQRCLWPRQFAFFFLTGWKFSFFLFFILTFFFFLIIIWWRFLVLYVLFCCWWLKSWIQHWDLSSKSWGNCPKIQCTLPCRPPWRLDNSPGCRGQPEHLGTQQNNH